MNARLILPELYMGMVALIFFVSSLSAREEKTSLPGWISWLAGISIPVTFFSLNASGLVFADAYRLDTLSQFFKLAISIGFFIAVLNATRQTTLDADKRYDYFLFITLSALGLMLLSSAVELITVYVAVEIASYSLYALIPLRSRERQAAEAGIKYILFGAVATAIALYGLSYIVAGQHTSYIDALAKCDWTWAASPMAVLGLVLFLAGFFYKLALFPFHFWAPDVYQGASNETATFISTVPKLGAVIILIRLTSFIKPESEITTILAILAAASMTYGNLAALVQKDIKRLLGYSTVAHAGYIVIGLVSGTIAGLAASVFYAFTYVLMNLTCFWVVCRVGSDGRNLELDDLNGLHKRAPGLALILAIGAFALVGLPPTGGFMGKLFLLSSAWNHGYNWLVILAAVNTAISIYYYLSMVLHSYTKDEPVKPPAEITEPVFGVFWGGVLAAAVLFMGIMPTPVFDIALKATGTMLP